MDSKVQTKLQAQHTMERTNSAIYQSLAVGLDASGWPGFSAFMANSAREETDHAQRLERYLIDRGTRVVFEGLDAAPLINSNNPMDYYTAALEREYATTAALTDLHMTAWNATDLETCNFLLWFFLEQTKSIGEITTILARLANAGEAGMTALDIDMREK
jgi:ferritin